MLLSPTVGRYSCQSTGPSLISSNVTVAPSSLQPTTGRRLHSTRAHCGNIVQGSRWLQVRRFGAPVYCQVPVPVSASAIRGLSVPMHLSASPSNTGIRSLATPCFPRHRQPLSAFPLPLAQPLSPCFQRSSSHPTIDCRHLPSRRSLWSLICARESVCERTSGWPGAEALLLFDLHCLFSLDYQPAVALPSFALPSLLLLPAQRVPFGRTTLSSKPLHCLPNDLCSPIHEYKANKATATTSIHVRQCDGGFLGSAARLIRDPAILQHLAPTALPDFTLPEPLQTSPQPYTTLLLRIPHFTIFFLRHLS